MPVTTPLAAGPVFGGFLRAVELSPAEAIAPVGTEVVMISGVCGQDGHLQARQRVEWIIDTGGVGQFVEVGRRAPLDWLLAAHTWPRKIDNAYAIGLTSSAPFTITRGTAATTDDVPILRGQAWTSITSAVEGVSRVIVMAPDVVSWGARRQTATIHWVDAQWSFPPPAINAVGARHVFTTSVARQSDQAPVIGWVVRYEILDGPSAGFAPDDAAIIDVPTDAAGQASAEIHQLQPAGGTNNIRIQILRPATAGGAGGRQLLVGSGAVTATWSAPRIALQMSAPATAATGDTATYQIDVSNPGDLAASDVKVTCDIPRGTTLVGTEPAVQPTGTRLEWTIDSLGAGQAQALFVDLRGDAEGTVELCASVTTAEGLTGSDCASTAFSSAALDVAMIGPGRATAGDEVTFEVTVNNRSATTATDLVAVSRYDVGLDHPAAASPLERNLADLGPGQSITFGITFSVSSEGELCNTVEVYSGDTMLAQTRECITAVAAAGGTAPNEGPPDVGTPPAGAASVSVNVTSPEQARVGETALFDIVVTNSGQAALSDVKIVVNQDTQLTATRATAGNERIGADLRWLVDALAVGQSIRYQVEYQCEEPAVRACSRVTVSSAQGARDDAQRCLAIAAVAADLEVTVTDRNDPIAVDRSTIYEVRVTNRSSVPDKQVELVVTVPDQLRPLGVGTQGPAGMPGVIRGQKVFFQALAEVRPEETVVYQVAAHAVSPGDATVTAEVSSQRTARPATATATTDIFAEP